VDPYSLPAGTPDARPFPDLGDEALTAVDATTHAQARALVREGRLHDAKRLFGRLAAAYPDHEVLVAQYNAVGQRIARAQEAAKRRLEAARPRAPEPPPAAYTLARRAPVADPVVPRLTKLSEKPNTVTDEDRWFSANGIHLPEYFVPPQGDAIFAPGVISSKTVVDLLTGFTFTELEPSPRFHPAALPVEIPLAYGTLPLTRAIDSDPYVVAIYGDRVVAVFDAARGDASLLDLGAYAHPAASRTSDVVVGEVAVTDARGTRKGTLTTKVHEITHDLAFALARDGVLYVEHRNMGYAKESRGQNAYVTALDLTTGEMLWRSAPLVANTHAFALVRGALVCGYGFTAEPDFVYVLDRATGRTAQTVPVRSGPEYVVAKDGKVHVRSYDVDVVLAVR